MGTPFLGEIRIMAFNFAPKGWVACNGQFLPINQNQGLFSILGTMYGGNGQTTFALPDFRGRAPVHAGIKFWGERGGEEAHTVSISELPAHTHPAMASSTTGNDPLPGSHLLASSLNEIYRSVPASGAQFTPLRAGTITSTGGSQPHNNMQPYLVLNFCIALQGLFPSQN